MVDVTDSNTVYYYHYDGLGSVIALSDMNNNVVERYSYDVFGEPNRVSDVNNPYLFTGRRFDNETGLYYYRARYYAYDIGRFLQTDPIGYADGINWYLYCGNNPIMLVDPMGLDKGGWWSSKLDKAQAALDVGGMWPGVGIFPDAVNTVVSVFRGNWGDAAFSAGAMIPGPGQASTTAKWLRRGASHVDEAADAAKGLRKVRPRSMTPDQQALKELVDEATFGGRRPLSTDQAETVLDWADEFGYPGARAKPGDVANPSNWSGGSGQPHIHIPGVGNGHIPVQPGVSPR
jgi:RHS repeat-associated protein